jgi:hypothetical protein
MAFGGGQVEVTPRMQANLYSKAFDIEALGGNPIQILEPAGSLKWQWLITAKEGGVQNLIFVIYRQAKAGDETHWHPLETERKVVQVNVTVGQRLLLLDWKWIIGTLATALLIPAFWRYVDNKKKETAPQTKPRRTSKKVR